MCEMTAGIERDTCLNRGGIKSIVVVPLDKVEFTRANDVLTAIVSQTYPAYRIKIDINSGSSNDNKEVNRENWTKKQMQSVMLMVKDDTLVTRQQLDLLTDGAQVVIVEKNNGLNYVLGVKNGMVGGYEAPTGQNSGDMNGATITMNGEEDAIAPEISNSLIANLLAYTS
jgi:hypothetical protein